MSFHGCNQVRVNDSLRSTTSDTKAALNNIKRHIEGLGAISSRVYQEQPHKQRLRSNFQIAVIPRSNTVYCNSKTPKIMPEGQPYLSQPSAMLSLASGGKYIWACTDRLQVEDYPHSSVAEPPDKWIDSCNEDSEHACSLDQSGVSICRPSALRPASEFEMSENFSPETYTIDRRLPWTTFMVTGSLEESISKDVRTNSYRVLYQPSPRKWRRLIFSLDIPRHSLYWSALKVSKYENNTMAVLNSTALSNLPRTMIMKIHHLLLDNEEGDEDTHLQLSLSIDGTVKMHHRELQNPSRTLDCVSTLQTRNVLAFLDDLGCPRYSERSVEQVALLEMPNNFISSIAGTLVYEVKFSHALPTPEQMYNIQLLRCMHGVPGFPKLIGIVVDSTGKHTRSYLVEYPHTRHIL